MTDKAEEDGDGGMVCHVSEMNPQDIVSSQTIYVTYGTTTSGALSEGDVFVLQAGDSDILASVFCGDIGTNERVVSIADDNTVLPGGFGYGTVAMLGDKERTDQREEISLSTDYQPLIGCDKRNMISSSGDKIQDDSTSRKSIFSTIRATISQEFLADPNLFAVLEKLTRELRIKLICDSALNESCVVGTDVGAFCRLEKMIISSAKEFDDKSTNTESYVEKHDRGVTCCLLTPQFTRSGREIRNRDYDIRSDYAELKSDVRPSTQQSKDGATNEGPNVRRKRGRPRKNPQKPNNAPSPCDNFFSNIITGLHLPNVDDDAVETQKRDDPSSVYPSETPLAYEASKSCLEETNGQVCGDMPEPAITHGDLQSDKINGGSESRSKNYELRAPFKHCTVCSFRTKRESHLLKHIQIHERDVPILHCSQCSFSTTRKNHLTRHEMQHKSTVYRCESPGCDYRTDNVRLLRRHAALHLVGSVTKARPHLACPISNCTYRTHRAHLLRRHLIRHTAVDGTTLVERYFCSACPYETRRREHYLRHVNAVHSEQCPYLCDHCGRGFKRKDSLAQHGFVHQERSNRLYQFECKTCNARFRSVGHLHDHQAKHSTERSYLCEICGSAFKTKAVQKKHVLSIHSKPRSHVCSICSKRFNTNYALRRHASSHVSKATGDTAAPVDAQPLSSTVQVAIIRGLPPVDHLRGGMTCTGMDSRVVTVNINSGQILSQVVVGTSQVFVPQVQDGREKDHPTS